MDFPTLSHARFGASTRSGSESVLATACVGILTAGLLALTLLWHIPMMLWDHLDLVPLYRAWQEGAIADSAFWDTHGGHMHAAAYAVLLLTTAVSGGQPWLDCAVSWMLLIVCATIVLRIASAAVAAGEMRRGWMLGVAFLALYPGHLANALHMIKQAATVAAETRTIAAQVRKTWPRVDDALLRGIYFEESRLAGERLEVLRTWSFPPFDKVDPGLPARARQ